MFNEIYDDRHFNVYWGIDQGVEPLAMVFWMYRTFNQCGHEAGFWNVHVSNKVIDRNEKADAANEAADL